MSIVCSYYHSVQQSLELHYNDDNKELSVNSFTYLLKTISRKQEVFSLMKFISLFNGFYCERYYLALKNVTDTPKPSRYLTRTQGLSSNSGSGIGSVGVGSSCSGTGTSTSSYSGLPQYPRRSPNKIGSNTNYTVGGIGTSSSWNSDLSSAASKTPNYKQLYEEEKLLTNGLREEVKAAQKELKELEDALENSVGRRRPSEVEQRKMERRISECEQELKLIEKLRAESEKLHAEHRALIRVVSRLNREQ
ncbi:unnamed protein product [Schistosoma margrebowiei]|uniref:cGMP-dependent protein kinase interacting domain-containing protein n=1 Tax=Schistosoma margrebowiei TaxID=48269 RepID=A0AA84ZAP7_9TREM|nr:unnamed protein product [Schistosoma margrebowiei]